MATKEEKYKGIWIDVLPKTECLIDCVERVSPMWHDSIAIDMLMEIMLLSHNIDTHFDL